MNAKSICIILACCVLVTSLIWCYKKIKNEGYREPLITFLTEDQAKSFLYSDIDNYLRNLTEPNLHALGADSHQECLEKWLDSCDNWKPREQEKLKEALAIVTFNLRNNLKDEVFLKQLQGIDWQFAKTIHPYYMDGLPHTRGDIIWLTDKVIALTDPERLARLLLHEKTHIWERKFPKVMKAWMDKQGFTPVGNISEDPSYRQNPDLDDKIYVDKHNRKMFVKFNSTKPRNLMDVSYSINHELEHPYEALAYRMEKYVE
jgi:hypothetical protein